MKILVILCLTVTPLLFSLIRQSEQAPPEKTCKMLATDLTKRQMKGIAQCTKKMKFKNGKDKSKKMNCILRCVLIKEKLLDENGLTNMDFYNNFLQEEFPPALTERFNQTFYSCMTIAFTELKPLDQDEYCSGIDPLMKCMMGQLPGLCN